MSNISNLEVLIVIVILNNDLRIDTKMSLSQSSTMMLNTKKM